MLYLLDANVLITANNTYYAIDQVPEFWEWIRDQGVNGRIKVPLEIIEEIQKGRKRKEEKEDPLVEWIRDADNHSALLLNEECDPASLQHVIDKGYASDLTEDEIEQLGRDPFLVAYAMAGDKTGDKRCVVTTEISKPSRKRQNRHLPDVCRALSVQCCNTFALTRALEFRTSWKS